MDYIYRLQFLSKWSSLYSRTLRVFQPAIKSSLLHRLVLAVVPSSWSGMLCKTVFHLHNKYSYVKVHVWCSGFADPFTLKNCMTADWQMH